MVSYSLHGMICSIRSRNSFFFVRACASSSLRYDRLICVFIPLFYIIFLWLARPLCGAALEQLLIFLKISRNRKWKKYLGLHGFGSLKRKQIERRLYCVMDTERWGRQFANFLNNRHCRIPHDAFPHIRINRRQWSTASVVVPKRFFAPKISKKASLRRFALVRKFNGSD